MRKGSHLASMECVDFLELWISENSSSTLQHSPILQKSPQNSGHDNFPKDGSASEIGPSVMSIFTASHYYFKTLGKGVKRHIGEISMLALLDFCLDGALFKKKGGRD